MSDKKPTDSEIKKALECCVKDDILEADNKACLECPMNDDNACTFNLRKYTLDLITRLQAENEQWKEEANRYQNLWCKAVGDIETAKAEAYKECIEKVKDEKFKTSVDAYTDAYILGEDDLDNLLKEMVGDN